MNYNDKLLDHYAEELGIEFLLLETLIESHRTFRTEVMRSREELNKEFDRIQQNVEKQTRESITEREYISVARLKKMNLQEITELINNHTERFE